MLILNLDFDDFVNEVLNFMNIELMPPTKGVENGIYWVINRERRLVKVTFCPYEFMIIFEAKYRGHFKMPKTRRWGHEFLDNQGRSIWQPVKRKNSFKFFFAFQNFEAFCESVL